jgi:GMP synthase-like glutamine amidotransferase
MRRGKNMPGRELSGSVPPSFDARQSSERFLLPTYLVAQSELPHEREKRRQNAGKSAGETYKATLRQLAPGARVEIASPADEGSPRFAAADLADYDAIFLTGSPMHVYDETKEVERQLDFMRAVFASGVPSFGSCAGLQVAVAAAGGKVRKMPDRMEAGIARRISATDAGRVHPLLEGRPGSWDAPAVHGDEVEELPPAPRCSLPTA